METFKVGTPVRVTNQDAKPYFEKLAVISSIPDDDGFWLDFFNKGEILYFSRSEVEEVAEWEWDLLHPDKPHPRETDFGVSVQEVVNEVRDTLIAKNKAYGNSALEPVRVFSTADPVEQIRVRIDDKLSRLKSSLNDDNEDTVLDLMGYLVLLRIATRKQDTE